MIVSKATPPEETGRPPYVMLIAMSAVGPLALNMFVPSMPGLETVFSASPGTVQLTLSLYLICIAFCQLFYGPLSDRYGRRPVLLVGLALFVAGSVACAMATSIEMLVVARALQGIGGAAGMILSRAIVRDLFTRERAASVLGYVTMAWVLAPMVAPSIGGLLDGAFSFRATFVFLSIVGIAVLAGAFFQLGETNAHPQPDIPLVRWDVYRSLLSSRAYLGYTATLSFASAVFFCYLATAPYVMVTVRGHSPLEYGLWFALPALGYMSGNYVSGRYSERLGNDLMIRGGNVCTLLGATVLLSLAVLGFVHPVAIFLPMTLCTFGNGLTIPNGVTAAISVDPNNIGTAAGLSGATQMFVAALAAQSVGLLQGIWPNTGFWVIASSALLAALSRWGSLASKPGSR